MTLTILWARANSFVSWGDQHMEGIFFCYAPINWVCWLHQNSAPVGVSWTQRIPCQMSHEKKTVPYFPLNPGFFNSDPYIMVYQNNPHIINWVRFNPLYIYTLNNLGPFLHCSDFSSENCYSCGTVLLVHRWQFNMSWVAQAVFSEKVKRSCPLAVSA